MSLYELLRKPDTRDMICLTVLPGGKKLKEDFISERLSKYWEYDVLKWRNYKNMTLVTVARGIVHYE